MQNAVIKFKKIYEHDMDLLIIEEFVSDRNFAQIFLDKLQLSDDYTIQKASHSMADADGESDITLILQYPDKRVALLIEYKIDAQTMPEQSERYHKRAQKAISQGEYDCPYVMLVAPLIITESTKTTATPPISIGFTMKSCENTYATKSMCGRRSKWQ